MNGFKTKARTVELLGRKQIRDSVTALAELMKNSYDADAPWLRVEFTTMEPNQHVVIVDSGLGMSQNDIESKWLVLGTNSKTKRANKTSPSGRPLMGAKGIGRLASATLGQQLWMFTKTKKSLWNIVFVNWDIFENPYISIEDVNVPTRFGISSQELLLRFDNIIAEMLAEQRSNLEHPGWHPENDIDNIVAPLLNGILNNLSKASVNKKTVKKYFASLNSGTILHIDQLHDDWNRYISPISSEARKNDVMLEKMYNRFASFISTFKHTVTEGLPFNVEIYIDGNLWEEDYDFTEDDYNYYDIKVSGEIKQGVFIGQLLALNADPSLLQKCNADLAAGISVTAGISGWKDVDCGKLKIKFCHLEGTPGRSSLSKDDYSRITRKLQTTCGICVYRDGVRVLPYGEPENDFLNIEERRSKKASRYIFSHRNIFGRIDINTEDNPMLEDKSSREGLIENAYYFYFVHTIENLLTILAIDYLSDVRADSLGIQQSYVSRNAELAEVARIRKEFEKQEQIQANELVKKAKAWCREIVVLYNDLYSAVNAFCSSNKESCQKASLTDGYDVLTSVLDRIVAEKGGIYYRIETYQCQKFVVPGHLERYFSESLLTDIAEKNRSIQVNCEKLTSLVEDSFIQASSVLTNLVDEWITALTELAQTEPQQIKTVLLDRLEAIIMANRTSLDEICQYSSDIRDGLLSDISPVLELLDSVHNDNAIMDTADWAEAQHLIELIAQTKSEIDSLFSCSPDIVVEKSNEIIAKLNKFNSDLLTITQRIHFNENIRLGALSKKGIAAKAAISEEGEYSGEQIIGMLREDNLRLSAELDIYSDLANMGLAAEIVNHEFNQLFINVNNAIRNMVPYVKNPSAKYWLRQIDMGFRSISDRQNQLSPMYRSYSLKKAPVQLSAFIDEVHRFTEGEIKRNQIDFVNEVSPNVVIRISKSKVFPALSNLINNSLYWVLNQQKRTILIRFDEASRTLYLEDSGAGIAAANKEKIFEPFVSYKPNGRGLGLTIARKVLESQGHRLEVASDSEKVLPGACFKIVFSEDAMEVN